ncbi:MAG: ABC transporter permease [Rhodobacteraceae bacterium]|nr:ABC transporter permease [Paracoccaceae bacterium]MCY4140189.1 ABC transporter permease [Paracoccaceae bacterium]
MRYSGGNLSLVIGGSIVLGVLLFVAFGPLVSGYEVEQMDMRNRLQLPSAEHWLGTDNFGRDLWTRMAVGARVSLAIALSSVAIAVVVGSVVGLVSGYFGGWLDLVIMRVVDVFLGFPPIVLALAIVAALGPGVVNLSLSLAAVFWTEYARVVRSVTLAQREADYVTSAVALGASNARILFREILPNVFGPVIVLATLGLGTAIIAESGLSFLGFGVEPPTPTWGWTLAYGTRYLRAAPWLSTVAGLAIMITVLGFNLFGDGLRDYLDPRGVARRIRRASRA